MWSLVTETKHGMDNRTEALPMTIDPQYTVGFSWARQYGLARGEEFQQQGVVRACRWKMRRPRLSTHNNGDNFLVGSEGAGGGLYNAGVTNCTTANNRSGSAPITTCSLAASYSFNPSPDIIAKVAFEPGFGHYEVFGIYAASVTVSSPAERL